ncbi:hypothetical protein A4X06_0g7386 [Tilletia controversa]|uniref:Uncharacterized protein n=1 Tax=Tilletia controversa TaxID=13291 RepID=A0A8X7SU65_9BASI|nr:hypothetical protein CF328_g7214 [Tilletia controversa]KAE8241832.1 hypothetical protein A4X06_0g7386 [Tilletia controversa]
MTITETGSVQCLCGCGPLYTHWYTGSQEPEKNSCAKTITLSRLQVNEDGGHRGRSADALHHHQRPSITIHLRTDNITPHLTYGGVSGRSHR